MSGSPSLRVVGVLVGGRAAFRAAVVLSAPVLLAAWGPGTFGPYALALGSTLVLNPLVGSGTEKSAGTLLPRARLSRVDGYLGRLLAAHLVTATAIAVGSLLLAVPFALADPERARLWLLAGATNVGFGAVQAVVAYWRVLGRPLVDPAGFGLLAVVTCTGLALAVAGAGPVTFLALQAGTAAAVSVALAVGLRRRLARPRRRTVRLVARTTALMGANTLLATAPFSVVIAVLGAAADAGAVSHVYVAVTAYTVLGNVLDYLQRVYQPWLTGALRSRPSDVYGPAGRFGRLARNVAVPAGVAVVVAAGWALAPPVAVLAAMAAAAPVLLAVAGLTWVLENAATATLGRTTRAGLAGLAGTAATALLLVPPYAATGALLALLAGAAVQLVLLAAAVPTIRTQTGNGIHDTRRPQPLRAG